MEKRENVPDGGSAGGPVVVAVAFQIALFVTVLAAILGTYAR